MPIPFLQTVKLIDSGGILLRMNVENTNFGDYMRQFTILLFVSVLGILLLAGCQESDSSQIRRARLIATENMQLKQNLEEKDQQIEELKVQIEALEVENANVIEQSGEASIKTLRMLLESEKRAEAIVIENRKLEEELEKLKAQ
jgi:outer membrane murein-binding lipoprotein Lpp